MNNRANHADRVQCVACSFRASSHGSMVIHLGNNHPERLRECPPESAWETGLKPFIRVEQSERDKPWILVADDDAMVREMLTTALTAQGWHVETAEDGADALLLWGTTHFDVLSTDMDMPEMNGLRLAKEVLSEHPKPVVFMFSGNDAARDLVMELGASGFYSKSDPMEYIGVLARVAIAHRAKQERA